MNAYELDGCLLRVTRLKGRASDRVPFQGVARLLRGTFGGDLLVVDDPDAEIPVVIARGAVLRTDLTVEELPR